MPLQLGGVETARRQVVPWNPEIPAECNDAKARVAELRNQGFLVIKEEDGEVTLDPPERADDQGLFRILSQNGDDRVIWDRRDKNQVKEAFLKFKELMKKGYTAYVTKRDGSRGHRITEFDPGLEEIILGADLGNGKRGPAGEATLVPKTVPG
jgi:hypothetical protein